MGTEPTIPKGVRIPSEDNDFLEQHGISLKEIVNDGIKNKKKQVGRKTKQEKIRNVITNGMYVIIGMVFFYMLGGIPPDNYAAMIIIVCMGFGFTIPGAYKLYQAFKEDNLIAKE